MILLIILLVRVVILEIVGALLEPASYPGGTAPASQKKRCGRLRRHVAAESHASAITYELLGLLVRVSNPIKFGCLCDDLLLIKLFLTQPMHVVYRSLACYRPIWCAYHNVIFRG